MSALRFSPLAVTGVLALLLLSALVAPPAAPAVAPNMQVPPTLTPTPTPTPIPRTGERIGPGRSSGDPHLSTPDGFAYDFQAAGEFIAVMSRVNDLAVQIRQEPVGTSTVASMNTAVATNVVGDRVGVYVGTQPALWVNGQPTTLGTGSLPLPRGGRVEQQGARYVIVWPDQTVAEVTLRSQYLDVVVRLAPARQGQVAGLFGNADGGAANDLTTRGGTVVDLTGLAAETAQARLYGEFGNSWRISQAESLFDYGPGENAGTYARLDFPSALITASDLAPTTRGVAEAVCRKAGVTEARFLADCALDVGLTGDPEFAASAAEVQAALAPTAVPTVGDTGLVGGLFRGQISGEMTVPAALWGFVDEDQLLIHVFSAEIRLDPTTQVLPDGQMGTVVTGGAVSFRVDLQEGDTTGQVRTFNASQAEGYLDDLPTGAFGLVVFTGTQTLESSVEDLTFDDSVDFFPLARDESGQLVLCHPGIIEIQTDAVGFTGDPNVLQSQCLANPLVVLRPVENEVAPPIT